jgi:hypothetical protein
MLIDSRIDVAFQPVDDPEKWFRTPNAAFEGRMGVFARVVFGDSVGVRYQVKI